MASLWQIFLVFAKIGSFTIGGGYAMIPLIREELVKRGWVSDEELPDIIALAQSAPGVLAVNMSIFAGYIVSRHKRLAKSATAAVKTAITASMINRFTCRPDSRAAVASTAKWIKMAAG